MAIAVAKQRGAELLTKKNLTVAIHPGRCDGPREFAFNLAKLMSESEFPCHKVTAKEVSELANGNEKACLNCRSSVRSMLNGKGVDFIIDFEVGSEFKVFSSTYGFDSCNAAIIGGSIMLAMGSKAPVLDQIAPLPALRKKILGIVKEIWKAPGAQAALMRQADKALYDYKTQCPSCPAIEALEHRLDAFMYSGEKSNVVEFYRRAAPAIADSEKGALLYSGKLTRGENGNGRKRAVLIEAPEQWFSVRNLADRFASGIVDGMQGVLGMAPRR